MAADPLTRLLARVETLTAGLFRRLSAALNAAITDAAPANAPLPAGATPALSRLIDREVGRVAGRDPGAVLDRDGRPLVPLAAVLHAAQAAGAGLAGAPTPTPAVTADMAQRIHAAGDETRRQVRARVAWHVANGTPVQDAAAEVAGLLRPMTRTAPGQPGGTDATYAARRLIANETRAAHATATVSAARASGGRYLVRWTLAESHDHDDECTAHAARNVGYGPGVYRPADAPMMPVHINCRCRWVIVSPERL